MDNRYMRYEDFNTLSCRYDDIKEWVYAILISGEDLLDYEKKFIGKCVCDPFPGGMYVILLLLLIDEKGTYYYWPVRESFLAKNGGISKMDAMRTGYKNAKKFDYDLYVCDRNSGMFLLSTDRKRHFDEVQLNRGIFTGSSIIDNVVLEELADEYDGNYYLLQISENSTIVTRDNGNVDTEELYEMLFYNENSFAKSVLYYDCELKMLMEVPRKNQSAGGDNLDLSENVTGKKEDDTIEYVRVVKVVLDETEDGIIN